MSAKHQAAYTPGKAKLPNEEFEVVLHIRTDCEEMISLKQLKKWVRDQFKGCDLGKVTVEQVKRVRVARRDE